VTFVIEQTIEVTATPAVVWEVIVDLPRYGEWNPFVVECRSTLAVGDPIDMRVHVFAAFAHPQRETILAHVPGERLCYGLPANPLGSLASRRCHELQAMAGARTRYRSRFELSGWLMPVVRELLGRCDKADPGASPSGAAGHD
jgi:hypothetical protein